MSNPTTPFSWQMPTNTDLVTDLPADFEVFGQAVATSMADLLGGTTGQILSKTSATDMDFTWIANDQGDITNIGVTSPITGGGSSGSVTIGIDDATTTVKGAVQLSDSTSTTSSVLAATPTAVKSAYDLANGAIAKTTVTTAGDVIYRNATVPTRLGIGTAGQVLTVNSGATAPQWSTPAGGGGMTLLSTTNLTGAQTINITGISQSYKALTLYIENFSSASDSGMSMWLNNDTTLTNYLQYVFRNRAPSTTADYLQQDSSILGYGLDLTTSYGFAYVTIPNYTSTNYKIYQVWEVHTGESLEFAQAYLWTAYNGTSAITEINIKSTTGNWDSGTVKIYGVN